MRSSTSSFERAVPQGRWALAGIVAAVILLVTMTGWELRVRAEGYPAVLNDSTDLWARSRSQVSSDPDQTVIVGSSRILFDLDLESYAEYFSAETPVELAMPGTNPVALIEDLAAEEKFQGTVILSVVPGLWFVPEGSPVFRAQNAIGRYHNWSPSQRLGLVAAEFLQNRLAFINADDLTLPALINKIQLENRPAAQQNLAPTLPSFFGYPDANRQNRMWDKCDFGSPLALKTQQTWVPLFTPPPPPPHLSPEEFGEMMAGNVEAHLARVKAAADSFRARDIKVVFVRPPSTGTLRELENQFTPREAFWERILEVSGYPGIHFEDYPELADFDCPEWSHLTAHDAVLFTRALLPHIEMALADQEGPAS